MFPVVDEATVNTLWGGGRQLKNNLNPWGGKNSVFSDFRNSVLWKLAYLLTN